MFSVRLVAGPSQTETGSMSMADLTTSEGRGRGTMMTLDPAGLEAHCTFGMGSDTMASRVATLAGEGELLSRGKEYIVTYHIEVTKSSSAIKADGFLYGLDPRDAWDLSGRSDIALRLEDGFEAEIAFFGGNIEGPPSFAVNTRLPGF